MVVEVLKAVMMVGVFCFDFFGSDFCLVLGVNFCESFLGRWWFGEEVCWWWRRVGDSLFA